MDLTIDRLTTSSSDQIAVDRVSTRLTPAVTAFWERTGRQDHHHAHSVQTCCAQVRRDTLVGATCAMLGDEYAPAGLTFRRTLATTPTSRRSTSCATWRRSRGSIAARRAPRSLELAGNGGPRRRGAAEGAHVLGRHEERLGIAQAVLNARRCWCSTSHGGLDPKEPVTVPHNSCCFAQDKIVILSTLHRVADVEYIADEISRHASAGAFIMQGAAVGYRRVGDRAKVWECHVDARRDRTSWRHGELA